MGTALVVLAVLLAALLLALAAPVELNVRCEGLDGLEARVGVRGFFGALRFDTRWPKPDRPPRRRPRATKRGDRSRGARGVGARVIDALKQSAFRRRLQRLASDLLHAVDLRELSLRVRLGLGDPADTGRLWAFVGPLGAAARDVAGAKVRIEPDFADAVLDFEARGRVRLVPLRVLALAVAFALSPESIRAWRIVRHGEA